MPTKYKSSGMGNNMQIKNNKGMIIKEADKVSYIEKINSATDLNDSVLVFNCPQQFRQLIAQEVCLNPQTYHCLRVRNNFKQLQFLQTCKYSRTPVPKGEYPIQDKNSGNLNSENCPGDEFQFEPSWSNEQSRCLFRKSFCNEEGQIIYSDENSSRDRRCVCDYTNGYKFTTYPINRNYCVPFEEDCSCYRDIKQEDSYTTGLILGCSKHMPIKVDNNETQADGYHTMTINEEQPNDSIFESDPAHRMGTRVVSAETFPSKPTDENDVNRNKHNAGLSKILVPRGVENEEKCLGSNDSKDIHGAEYTVSPVRDITVMSVECDNSVESYVQHLKLLNRKYEAGATIELFPENAPKEQQEIILRSSRHIFIYITANFTIQKFKQVVDFEYLKRKYFADPINIDRVKLIYDNAGYIPEELKALNSIPFCTDGNSEIYNNRMQYYFVVRKN
ncbi:unnamed protein product [Mytilus edulis]|uniref:Uncharacterized protein n=1 Tax=Mytilus edulis TaxID=6550 RepID=A0A8S3QE27_MYTED|nr:unnamed protein product [Mytilus edulis]